MEVAVENSGANSLPESRLKVMSLMRLQVAASDPPATAPKPRLLDQVRQAIRTRQYSYQTEKAYVG